MPVRPLAGCAELMRQWTDPCVFGCSRISLLSGIGKTEYACLRKGKVRTAGTPDFCR